MGEVYRARDTRLERSVAIKVLPSEFADNESLRLRFEREAKTISSLSHPHICALFDVGETDGRSYLVMEFLEGESLADRLMKGPLPIDQALKLGAEIASALDSAHRQGITHRDIKPGNIMLTKGGAKLLDFGLAKQNPSDAVLGAAHTEKKPITEAGAILGTYQYMAPEQVEGQPADARTDIFALGAVLYEAATGQRAFEGKSRASLIAAILDFEPPPISAVRPLAPVSLDRVVRACLRKDPDDRIQTAHDLVLHLTWIREGTSAAEGTIGTAARRRRRWLIPALVSLLAVTGIVFATLYTRERSRAVPPSTFSILNPPDVTNRDTVAIAPDGRSIVYAAARPGQRSMLWLRRFDDPAPRVIAGTEGANWPFWSPDGQSIGFYSDLKLKRVNVATGSIHKIADGDYGVGATWSPDGTILFSKRFNDGLYRVRAAGGEPQRVTTLDARRGESLHGWPQFLSDGRHFVFLNRTTAEVRNQIAVASLDGGAPKLLVKADSLAGFDRPWLLYVRENVLYAHNLDETSLELRGDPTEIARNVVYNESWATSGVSVSPSGAIAYYPVFVSPADIRIYDRSGSIVRTLLTDNGVSEPALSPDGKRMLLTRADPKKGAADIWIIDPERGVRTRLTGGLANNQSGVWSPDGTRVVFVSDRAGMYDVYIQAVDDVTPPVTLWKSGQDKQDPDWAPGGQSIVVALDSPDTRADLYIASVNGETPKKIVATDADEEHPAVSPDGRWVAFRSDRSGTGEVYVIAIGGGRITQISTSGGEGPVWSGDGSELFYVGPDHALMSVPIRMTGSSLAPGMPRALFTLPRMAGDPTFSITPDGHFMIAASNQNDVTPDHIDVLLGWRGKLQ